ncbi:MAG: hypothetical protein MJZ97_05545, partial [Bacteroidales bacterium]|nr:hypothetical protein [Bacteroidales bacterium]
GQETKKTGQETKKTGQETKKTGQETESTGKETSSPKVLSLIKVIGGQTLTLKEIMNGLNMKNRDNFMKNYLFPAIADGYLAMLYPEVPRHRKQAYYLTEKGLSVCKGKE